MSKEKIGDTNLAKNIIMIYAEKGEIPTSKCKSLGIEEKVRCDFVSKFMSDGVGTIQEKAFLIKANFSESFVSALFGPDGVRPIVVRTKLACINAMKAEGAEFALAVYLDDEDPIVRQAAAKALGNLGVKEPEVVDLLVSMLDKDSSADIRMEAARALGKAHQEVDQDIVDDVAVALGKALLLDNDPAVRAESARALGHLRERGEEGVTALSKALIDDASPYVRECAAYSLGYIGNASKDAVGRLAVALHYDVDPAVRLAAALSLGHSTPTDDDALTSSVVDSLITAFAGEETNADVLYAVEESLAEIGSKTDVAVSRLITWLNHEDPQVKIRVAATLGRLGLKAKDALPKLHSLAKNDADATVRKNANAAFNKIVHDKAS